MPRLNFSIDDHYSVTPVARTARQDGGFPGWLLATKATEKSQRPVLLNPLMIKLAVAMFLLAAAATLVVTGSPIHLFQ